MLLPILLLLPPVLAQETGEAAPSVADVGTPQRPAVSRMEPEVERTVGSTWVESEALQLLGLEGNTRRVGDLITIQIVEQTRTAVDSATKSERTSQVGAGISALFGIETSLLAANPNMGESISMDVSGGRTFDGSGTTSRDSAVEATITCEVIEILPGGNLRVWGWKQVRVNRETQYVVLEGIVRPQDIQMDNRVSSDLLAQARIEITGRGVVDDPQNPGIGTRVLDRVWPF